MTGALSSSEVQPCALSRLPKTARESIFSYIVAKPIRKITFRGTDQLFDVCVEPKLPADPLFLLFQLLPRLDPRLMDDVWENAIVECLPPRGEEHTRDGSHVAHRLITTLGPVRFNKFRHLRVGTTLSSFMQFDECVLPFLQMLASNPPARRVEHIPIALKRTTATQPALYCARFSVSGLLGLDLIMSISNENPRKRKKTSASKDLSCKISQRILGINARLLNRRAQLPRVDFTKILPSELRQQILDPFVPVHCSDKAIYYNFSRLPGRSLLHVNQQLRYDFLEYMRSRCVFQLSCDRHLTKLREFFELTNFKRLKLLYIGLKKVHGPGEMFENDMTWLKDLIRSSPYKTDFDKAREMIRPFLYEYKYRTNPAVPPAPETVTSDYYFRIDGLSPPSIVIIKVHATSRPWLEWTPDFRELVLTAHLSNMVGKACDNLKAEAAGEVNSPSADHEMLERMFKIRNTTPGTRIIFGEDDGHEG